MTTAEDAFSLYERNAASIYHNCARLNRLETCPIQWEGKCLCQFNVPVFSRTIGNAEVPCDMKRRCYVKPGQECPICFESILTKTSAYLTCCGHAFHKKCIFELVESKWLQSYPCTIHCPLCRTYLGSEIYEMTKRYNVFVQEKPMNYLDRLEEFWIGKDFELIVPCSDGFDHAAVMKKGCSQFKKYIKTGEYD